MGFWKKQVVILMVVGLLLVAHRCSSVDQTTSQEAAPDSKQETTETWTEWAKEKLSETIGKKQGEDAAHHAKDTSSGANEYGAEKAREMASSGKEKAEETTHDAKEMAQNTAERAKEAASEAKKEADKKEEEAEEHVGWAKDKAQQGYEAAKQKASDAVEGAKHKSQQVKDKVAAPARDDEL